MRSRGACAISLLLTWSLPACSTVKEATDYELHYPGGVAGNLLDRYFIVSARDSKELQLYRDAQLLALFATAARRNITDAKEADVFIERTQDAMEQINFLAAHLYLTGTDPCNPTATPAQAPAQAPAQVAAPSDPSVTVASAQQVRCTEYRTSFERDLPDLERKLLNVAFSALPKEQTVALYTAARRLEPVATVRAFLALAGKSLLTFHDAAADYRTDIELDAGLTGEQGGKNQTVLSGYCYLLDKARTQEMTATPMPAICTGIERKGDYRLKEITIDDFLPVQEDIQKNCLNLPMTAAAQNEQAFTNRRTACVALQFVAKSELTVLKH